MVMTRKEQAVNLMEKVMNGKSYLTYKEIAKIANLDVENIKPAFQILSYPVISLGEYSHESTRKNISNCDPEIIEKNLRNHHELHVYVAARAPSLLNTV